jgi:hypothetical protein
MKKINNITVIILILIGVIILFSVLGTIRRKENMEDKPKCYPNTIIGVSNKSDKNYEPYYDPNSQYNPNNKNYDSNDPTNMYYDPYSQYNPKNEDYDKYDPTNKFYDPFSQYNPYNPDYDSTNPLNKYYDPNSKYNPYNENYDSSDPDNYKYDPSNPDNAKYINDDSGYASYSEDKCNDDKYILKTKIIPPKGTACPINTKDCSKKDDKKDKKDKDEKDDEKDKDNEKDKDESNIESVSINNTNIGYSNFPSQSHDLLDPNILKESRPLCPKCPDPVDSAFECKKVPNYRSSSINQYLPMPILNDFSKFQ